jgi:hypothetical protein
MRIGILGSGEVGRTLGTGFADLGDEVKIGSRDPRKPELQEWVRSTGARASSGTFGEAASFAEIAVLATLWEGTENALRLAGAGNLRGKVVIDLVNPFVFTPGKPPSLAVGHDDSAGEQVQRWLPESRVVKAFNIVGKMYMVHPDFPGGPPDMFICGNDAAAKQAVAGICTRFGWPSIDIGGIEGARLLEPLANLWVVYGIRSGSWGHAFKLLRK